MHPEYTPRDTARLDRRTDFNGPVPPHRPDLGNCWPYIGQPSQPYPEFKRWWRDGFRVDAHVAAYEIRVGPIPDGLWVLHHCDLGRCTRPPHLFLGSPKDNMDDMNAKGRGKYPGPTVPHRGPRPADEIMRGSHHPMHILIEQEVRTIRLRYAAGETDMLALAREFGMSESAISAIIYRHNWPHTDIDIPKPHLGPAQGETHGRHILTAEQVREIRLRFRPGVAGHKDYATLAREFGVKPATISAVVNGRLWKHINP